MKIKKARREQKKLRFAVSGQPGAGKTYAALMLAEALVGKEGKIIVFDTEYGRASLYSDRYEFDTWIFDPSEEGRDVSYKDYINIIKYAEDNSYDVIILDSVTPEWKDINRIVNSMKGNTYQNWGKVKDTFHSAFVNAILYSKIHVICTIRAKEKTDLVEGRVVSKGIGEEQDSDLKYYLDFVFSIQDRLTHTGVLEKSPPGLSEKYDGLDGLTINSTLIEDIRQWLAEGLPEETSRYIIRIKQLHSEILSLNPSFDITISEEDLSALPKEELVILGKSLAETLKQLKKEIYNEEANNPLQ